MNATCSLVFGTLANDLLSSPQVVKGIPAQEFAKDEVLMSQSLDPYKQISRANYLIAAGKSLALDAAERSRLALQAA